MNAGALGVRTAAIGVAIGVVLGAGCVLGLRAITRGTARDRALPASEASIAAVAPAPPARLPGERRRPDLAVGLDLGGAPVRGPADAPVTIVVFEDFEDVNTARAHPILRQLLIDRPNDVRVAFRHLPLSFHGNARLAHRAALAAERQGKFWEMREAILDQPEDLSRSALLGCARRLGLDVARFEVDLDDPAFDAMLERDRRQAESVGIRGTPTLHVNGRILDGAQPYDVIARLVDDETARAQRARAAR